MDILKPYRAQIDALDAEIVTLLKQRYDVIRAVADIKAREGIPSYIQERVDEVRENAGRMAAQQGIDDQFIKHLYAQLIQHSCDLEESIITREDSRVRGESKSVRAGRG